MRMGGGASSAAFALMSSCSVVSVHVRSPLTASWQVSVVRSTAIAGRYAAMATSRPRTNALTSATNVRRSRGCATEPSTKCLRMTTPVACARQPFPPKTSRLQPSSMHRVCRRGRPWPPPSIAPQLSINEDRRSRDRPAESPHRCPCRSRNQMGRTSSCRRWREPRAWARRGCCGSAPDRCRPG